MSKITPGHNIVIVEPSSIGPHVLSFENMDHFAGWLLQTARYPIKREHSTAWKKVRGKFVPLWMWQHGSAL